MQSAIAQTHDANTGSVTLSWMPPLENVDGTVLANLAGYRIYRGALPNELMPHVSFRNPGLSRLVIDGLKPGVHFFAIKAINSRGEESELSRVIGIVVR